MAKTSNNDWLLLAGAGLLVLLATRKRTGIGAIVDAAPPGQTPCLDGKHSTFSHGPGVCSYHGGISMRKEKEKSMPLTSYPSMIQPDKSVSASIQQAILDVITRVKRFTDLKPMEAGIMYNAFKNNALEDDYLTTNDTQKTNALAKSLSKKGYLEFMFSDFEVDKKSRKKITISYWEATEKVEDFINTVNARLQTLRQIKSGSDLFPAMRGFKNRII